MNHFTATHCNTLQHTATHCNTLQHTATHCNTLQHTANYVRTTIDKWIISGAETHINYSVSHVTHRWVMSHMYESCHVHMSRETCKCVGVLGRKLLRESFITHRQQLSNMLSINTENNTINTKNSPVNTQKSPVNTRKSPVNNLLDLRSRIPHQIQHESYHISTSHGTHAWVMPRVNGPRNIWACYTTRKWVKTHVNTSSYVKTHLDMSRDTCKYVFTCVTPLANELRHM